VRILLDQNLSPGLISRLRDVLPDLESIYDHDLTGASDPVIFDWARENGCGAIISADKDFLLLAEKLGPPPKVIRIERCDFPSRIVELLIRREVIRINDFLESDRATLVLRNRP
jgi:predicted nuclease of predicted toxin-antitoxin system